MKDNIRYQIGLIGFVWDKQHLDVLESVFKSARRLDENPDVFPFVRMNYKTDFGNSVYKLRRDYPDVRVMAIEGPELAGPKYIDGLTQEHTNDPEFAGIMDGDQYRLDEESLGIVLSGLNEAAKIGALYIIGFRDRVCLGPEIGSEQDAHRKIVEEMYMQAIRETPGFMGVIGNKLGNERERYSESDLWSGFYFANRRNPKFPKFSHEIRRRNHQVQAMGIFPDYIVDYSLAPIALMVDGVVVNIPVKTEYKHVVDRPLEEVEKVSEQQHEALLKVDGVNKFYRSRLNRENLEAYLNIRYDPTIVSRTLDLLLK